MVGLAELVVVHFLQTTQNRMFNKRIFLSTFQYYQISQVDDYSLAFAPPPPPRQPLKLNGIGEYRCTRLPPHNKTARRYGGFLSPVEGNWDYHPLVGARELIAKATYDQCSHGIVHVRHLYESHLPVLREELEGFHGEAVLGESFLDLLLSYRSSEKVKLNVA